MPLIEVGINYPWYKCGWDFGASPWGRKPWATALRADLQNLKNLGIKRVRWFILADGFIYGSGANSAPKPDLRPGHKEEWRFINPPRLSQSFLDDFKSLLIEFRHFRIKLLPSLISFEICLPGSDKDDKGRPLPPGFIKGGRSDLISDPNTRNKFFDCVLEPLLGISRGYRDVVDTWEVINEPEWVTKNSGVKGKYPKTVSLKDMLAFIREGVRRINTRGFRSTVGYSKYESVLQWEKSSQKEFNKSLNITLHQFHYYPHKERYYLILKRRPKIPLHVFDPRWPCFVGEFASAEDEPWPELKSQDVYSRLKLIERKGFPSAFIWSVHGIDTATDWSSQVQQMIGKYISGR